MRRSRVEIKSYVAGSYLTYAVYDRDIPMAPGIVNFISNHVLGTFPEVLSRFAHIFKTDQERFI